MQKLCAHTLTYVSRNMKRNHLKEYYDGYHFSEDNMVDIYNPYSLINALEQSKIRNYWAASGATSLLLKFVDNMELRLKSFENCRIM